MLEKGESDLVRFKKTVPTGSFRSDILQHFLLPYFVSNEFRVDPYDGAYFEGSELDELIGNLERGILDFSNKVENWPLDDKDIQNYYSSGKTYSIDLLPPRDEALKTFQTAIELARLAIKKEGKLIFIGD